MMKRFRMPHYMRPMLYGLAICFTFLQSVTVQGATYFVAPTGLDSNPGTSSSPWRNPQKCAHSPIRAGDTCIVRSGTYTDTDGDGAVVFVHNRSSTPSGTASAPITIKSEKPLGAAFVLPNNKGFAAGFQIYKPYYIIEGFDISGGNSNGTSAGSVGIQFLGSATGGVARSNAIHHIGRSSCTNSTNTFSGVAVRTSSILVERNRIYSIGRRRNGESSCSTSKDRLDHGIYVSAASNTTIRRNVIYDSNRGYAIHVYGGTTTNLNIHHNSLSGRSPTGSPVGQIILSSTIKTANVRNNVSMDARYGMVYLSGLSASGVTISYNLSNTATKFSTSMPSGVTLSNNIENINPAFIDASRNDFRLTSSSPAINRGTTSGVPVVSDGKPDIGGYEYSVQNNTASPLTPTGLKVQ